MTATYTHEVRVRYADCDMQRIVFNAHYLAYVDDASECWMRSIMDGSYETWGFDFVLKRADIVWHGAATVGNVIAIDVEPKGWGRTSFEVGFDGRVGDRQIFTATITYVSVTPGTTDPVPPPEDVKAVIGP